MTVGKVTLLLILGAFPLWGRDVSVTVLDQELGIPLEGAQIRSFDGSMHEADELGVVTLDVPDNSVVAIQGAYPGYASGNLVIEPDRDEFVLELRLTGIMENQELVIEASRPGESESRTGRSVGISEREIQRTGEIGVVEDVMNSIKLLPGVGYSGLFNAMPSIRGGQPGDLMAAMDGFYISNPYFWGGAFSIFDPRMVKSAQLSHGVFSARYGHTISGLLNITTKKPSSEYTEFELGLSTSAANANISIPINKRGGVMFMGNITYYDPVIWLAQGISKISGVEDLKAVEGITTAPNIRSVTLTSDYRFTDTIEANFTGFFGADGVAAAYKNEGEFAGFSSADIKGHLIDYQGFGLFGINYIPRGDMALHLGAGGGYQRSEIDARIVYTLKDLRFNGAKVYDSLENGGNGIPLEGSFDYESKEGTFQSTGSANAQGRVDFDWELGRGFIVALGGHELYSNYFTQTDLPVRREMPTISYIATHPDFPPSPSGGQYTDYVSYWTAPYQMNAENQRFATSAYSLVEYASPRPENWGGVGTPFGSYLF